MPPLKKVWNSSNENEKKQETRNVVKTKNTVILNTTILSNIGNNVNLG